MRATAIVVTVLAALLGGAIAAAGGNGVPEFRLPDALEWRTAPWDTRVQAAWVLGTERGDGPYLQRVRIAPGGRVPLHSHPDTRQTTVLSGTLNVRFPTAEGPGATLVLPAGAAYVARAGRVHEVWAGDVAVEYQEAGSGPTATDFTPP